MVATLCLGSDRFRYCVHLHQLVHVHRRQLSSVCCFRACFCYSGTIRRRWYHVSRESGIVLPLQANTNTWQDRRRHTNVQQPGHTLGADHIGLYQRSHHPDPVCLVLLGRSNPYKEQVCGSLMVWMRSPSAHITVAEVCMSLGVSLEGAT
jgi:hypothetical protein